MGQSMLQNQETKNTVPKKWIEVSCRVCEKLLSSIHFCCQNCRSKFCLKCYKVVISVTKTCTCCNLNLNQIIEIQESIKEYQSALIICKFSYNGCKTILPYKEINIHKLECNFKCPRSKNENLIEGTISQILSKSEFGKTSSSECKSAVLRKEIEMHYKHNSFDNLASCLFCKIKIRNECRKEHSQFHSQFSKMNLIYKECKLYHFDKNRSFHRESLKNIIDTDLRNANEHIIKKGYDDFNSNNKNDFNNLATLFAIFNFSKIENSNNMTFKNNKTLKKVSRIKGKKELAKNYYLFYFDQNGKYLHIRNMKTSETFLKELYYSIYCVDASFHQNSIFVCGGYNQGDLNTCVILDLNSKSIDKTKILNEKKSSVSLISTGIIIFCLGGYNGKDLKTCEYFNKENLHWIKINPLNKSNNGITSSFDSQKYIYTFGGGRKDTFERFNSSILTERWELLNVSNASQRFYGNSFLINDNQFLVFGGGYTQNNNFYLLNINSQKLEKLNKEIKRTKFFSSKPFYFEKYIWVVSQYPEKKIFKVNAVSLDFEVKDTYFKG